MPVDPCCPPPRDRGGPPRDRATRRLRGHGELTAATTDADRPAPVLEVLLAFELADAPGGSTQLRAQTYAAFPGVRGRVYRTLVIGTRAHVVATNRMLRSVRRLSRQAERGPA